MRTTSAAKRNPEMVSVDKYGFIDTKGGIVIRPQFDDVSSFHEGLCAVSFGKEHRWGYIDKSGRTVVKPQFEHAYEFSEGLANVAIDGKFGFIDRTGSMVIKPSQHYKVGATFSEGLAATAFGSKDGNPDNWGFIGRDGKLAIAAKFRCAGDFSRGKALVADDRGWCFINKAGRIVQRFKHQPVNGFTEGLAPVHIGRKDGYVDESDNLVISPSFTHATNFSEGRAAVQIAADETSWVGGWRFVDRSGRLIGKRSFLELQPFSCGMARVQIDDGVSVSYGYVDLDGKTIIKPQYEQANTFSERLALVKAKSGDWRYVDKKGDAIITEPRLREASGDKTASLDSAPDGFVEGRAPFRVKRTVPVEATQP